MTFQPDKQKAIYERVRDAIAAASSITNFTEGSPERAISEDMFAAEMRERQHELLSVQMASRVDYAGKIITENDLEAQDIDPEQVDLDLLNSYQEESDLDEFAHRNGVTRDPGAFATGEVQFTTTSDTVNIEAGAKVGTEPDSNGDSLIYTTDEDATPASGSTTVTVPVTAEKRGAEYNIGPDSITYLPTSLSGVSSVTNPTSTTNGQDEESTANLRTRTKGALVNNSGGGTVDGVEGGLVNSFSGLELNDVIVDEFFDPDTANGDRQNSNYADVIVDGGGTDTEIKDKLDELRPTCIKHYLVRPTDLSIDVTASVTGTSTDIDTTSVESAISSYITELGLGDNLIRDQIIATIINADEDIVGIDSLTVTIADEAHTYDSDNSGGDAPNHPLYKLNKGDSMAADGIVEVTGTSGGASTTFVEDTDFIEGTVDGSGDDAINWDPDSSTAGLQGAEPDEDTVFYVDYNVPDDVPIDDREKARSNTIGVTVV